MNRLFKAFRIFLTVVAVAVISFALFACGEEPAPETPILPSPDDPGTAGLVYGTANDADGNGYAFVRVYEGTETVVRVASEAGGFPVKEILETAFRDNVAVEEIVLPNTVEKLPSNAFNGCAALASVTADGVTAVGADAFRGTALYESLKTGAYYFNKVLCDYKIADDRVNTVSNLRIEDGTVSVTPEVLRRLTSITEIVIPNDLNDAAVLFEGLSSVQKITVREGGAGTLSSSDGVLYDDGGSVLLKYPEGKSNAMFSINAGVREIAPRAMINGKFTSVVFQGVVETVGAEAFLNCSSLTTVNYGSAGGFINVGNSAFKNTGFVNFSVPAALENLGSDNFSYSKLRQLRFAASSNLKTVGDRCFKGCADFTGTDSSGNLVFPNTLEKIGDSVFYGCLKLKTADVGDGLKSLGGAAFYGIENLETAVLSDALEEIGGNAFYGCVSLSEIVVPYTLKEIGNSAFKNCASLEAVYFGEKEGSDYASAKLERIGFSAFENCSSLVSFTMPHGLASVGSAAFRNSGLASLRVLRNKALDITKIGLYSFDGARISEIIVPINSVEEYKNATGWSIMQEQIFAANVESGTATVFFATDGGGVLVEKTAPAAALVLNRNECNIEIPAEYTVETSERTDENGNVITVTKITETRRFIEGWYLSNDFSEESKVVFGEDGTYRPEVSPNSYITLYAKWATEVKESVTEEGADA